MQNPGATTLNTEAKTSRVELLFGNYLCKPGGKHGASLFVCFTDKVIVWS